MKLKFERGEIALLDQKEVEILVARKNFSTKKIMYKLASGEEVEESRLKKLKVSSSLTIEQKALLNAHEKYEKLFSKKVPVAKKNKLEWILDKIEKAAPAAPAAPQIQQTPYEVLKELDRDSMETLIIEKNLDIEAEDYDDEEELLLALAEELGVEIPSKD
jgi:hypothetical protein